MPAGLFLPNAVRSKDCCLADATALLTGSSRSGPMIAGLRVGDLAINAAIVVFLLGSSGVFYGFGLQTLDRTVWIAADLCFLAWAYFHPHRFARLAREHAVFVAWGGLAVVSTIWSLQPWLSFYQGMQLVFTVCVALMIGAHVRGLDILKLVAVTLAISQLITLAAIALSPWTSVTVFGEWRGAYSHKNTLGVFMSLQILTCICLYLVGWRRIVVALSAAVAAFLLLRSRSSTALIVLAIALLPLPFAMVYRWGLRLGLLFVSTGLVGASALLALLAIGDIDVAEVLLDGAGKDKTLTGRTVLWEFAFEAFLERPFLGHGFRAYWEDPGTSAYYLREAVGQDLWFFHNCFIEVAVAFGLLGPLVMAAGVITAFSRTIRSFLLTGRPASLWAFLVVLYVTVYSFTENPLFVNNGFHQFIFVAAVVAVTSADKVRQWGVRSLAG